MGLLQVLVLLTMLSVQLGQSSSLTSLVKYNIWDFIIHYSCDSGVRMSGGWVHKLYIILLGFTEQVCGCTNVVWKSNTDRSHQYWYVRNATIWATINVRIFFFFFVFSVQLNRPKQKMLLLFMVASLSFGRLKLIKLDVSTHPKWQIW